MNPSASARTLHFAWLDRPYSFNSPCPGVDFAVLVVALDSMITAAEQDQLSDELVRSGCRYAVCTGYECSSWDDSIDLAFLANDSDCNPPDDRFVMTTWHDDEPLEDVAVFFRDNTAFDYFVPCHFVVLVIGGNAAERDAIQTTVSSKFVAGP